MAVTNIMRDATFNAVFKELRKQTELLERIAQAQEQTAAATDYLARKEQAGT